MDTIGWVVSFAGALLLIAGGIGLVIGTILRSTKNEIINDQEIRIKQLEGQHERDKQDRSLDREQIAELRGEIQSIQRHFTNQTIATVSEGVVTVVAQMLMNKHVEDDVMPQ